MVGGVRDKPRGRGSGESRPAARAVADLTDVQVAEQLFLSPRTIHSHLRSIYRKLGVSSRRAATRYAIEPGLPSAQEATPLSDDGVLSLGGQGSSTREIL
jgi:hypothetical protein